MTASADRLVAAGPRPKELWQTVCFSVLLHGLLLAVVVLMPRFRVGTYVTVPVSYTVNLVSAAPGGRAARPATASPAPRPAPPPAPAPPARPAQAPQTRPAPPPRPAAAPDEELTLPGGRPAKKAPAEVEPSLRPPSLAGRETLRPTRVEARPQPPAAPVAPAPPTAPAAPAAPDPAVAAAAPKAAPSAGAADAGKAGGVELANGEKGDGSGGSALGYYLGLVDYKISTNWVPVATGGAKENIVVIRFRVLRSGHVKDMELETSSGDAGLDAAAQRAIRQSLPLPPFPNLLTEPFLNLRYRFVMERT